MRSRSRQRRQNRSDAKDRWMITYADLITLLLIFFVIMFAMSRLDIEKYETITQSLQLTFKSGDSLLEKGHGILGSGDPYSQVSPPATSGQDDQGNKSSNDNAATPAPMTERELAFRKQEEELLSLMNMIQQYIKDNKLEDQIRISDLPKGISITLSDRFLFDVGRADLKQDSAKTLSKLASLFRSLNTIISIEGHTDSVPVGEASKFKDNWELSGARALSVLRYFIDQAKLSPDGFQYAGYADTRPAGDNNTAEGRQKNRRVEITVLRQLQQ